MQFFSCKNLEKHKEKNHLLVKVFEKKFHNNAETFWISGNLVSSEFIDWNLVHGM